MKQEIKICCPKCIGSKEQLKLKSRGDYASVYQGYEDCDFCRGKGYVVDEISETDLPITGISINTELPAAAA